MSGPRSNRKPCWTLRARSMRLSFTFTALRILSTRRPRRRRWRPRRGLPARRWRLSSTLTPATGSTRTTGPATCRPMLPMAGSARSRGSSATGCRQAEEKTAPRLKTGAPPYVDPRRGLLPQRVAHRVLRAADRVLHLAGGLLGLAFALQLRVTGYLASSFLDGTLDLVGSALDPILVHNRSPSVERSDKKCGRPGDGSPSACRKAIDDAGTTVRRSPSGGRGGALRRREGAIRRDRGLRRPVHCGRG